MPPIVRSLPAAAALVACTPAAADAYVLAGAKWPGGRVTYFNATSYRYAVPAAARTWNESGARVRFVQVRRPSAAQVVVRHDPGGASAAGTASCAGYASLGRQRGAYVNLRRRCPDGPGTMAVAAHELGHVLGLNHTRVRCAVMTPVVLDGCEDPPLHLYRCRTLFPDDVRGAVRRYGGRVRAGAGGTCPKWGRPPAPTALRAAPSAGGTRLVLTWRDGRARWFAPFVEQRAAVPARDPARVEPMPEPAGPPGGLRRHAPRRREPGGDHRPRGAGAGPVVLRAAGRGPERAGWPARDRPARPRAPPRPPSARSPSTPSRRSRARGSLSAPP